MIFIPRYDACIHGRFFFMFFCLSCYNIAILTFYELGEVGIIFDFDLGDLMYTIHGAINYC